MLLSLGQPKPEVHLKARGLQVARHNPWLSGCGQKQIETPHFDRQAADGIQFTQSYVGPLICSPARTAFTTSQVSQALADR